MMVFSGLIEAWRVGGDPPSEGSTFRLWSRNKGFWRKSSAVFACLPWLLVGESIYPMAAILCRYWKLASLDSRPELETSVPLQESSSLQYQIARSETASLTGWAPTGFANSPIAHSHCRTPCLYHVRWFNKSLSIWVCVSVCVHMW